MTEKVFEACFGELMKSEGGYVNDPKDPGGETKYGISKRAYPEEDIKALTKDRAKFLFKRDYWNPCKCDLLPDALAVCVSDAAYNSGNLQAVKWLQRAIGAGVDGLIGNQTLSMANRCDVSAAVEKYCSERVNFLKKLKNWERFGKGWALRVNKVEDLAKRYV